MDHLDVAFGRQVFRVGTRITVAVAVASILYCLATPDGPNRGWLIAISALALVDAAIVERLPHRRLIERGYAEILLTVWSALHVVVFCAASLLDGADSPYVGLFFVSVAFASVCLPPRLAIVLTALNILGLTVVGLQAGIEDVALWPMLIRSAALAAIAGVCTTIAADRRTRLVTLRHHNVETVRRLALVVEHRDHDTGGHIERIGSYSAIIAGELGFCDGDRDELHLAATLHDVGKVGTPDTILLKPGPLTTEERQVMQRHAQIGHDMLAGSGIAVLDLAATIALTHHERFDGAGYPNGLAGADIPLSGRIVAVVDVFDALTSDRPYKHAASFEDALEIVCSGSGTQFDPRVVDALLARLDEIRTVHDAPRASAPAPAPAPVAAAA